MNKKLERFSQKFPLTGAGIEELSETLEEKLKLVGVETQNRIRVRFSTEESLLRMRDQFGENTTVTLSMWTRFGRPVLQIEQEGERYNPLSKTEVELEDWSGTLLTAVIVSLILETLCEKFSLKKLQPFAMPLSMFAAMGVAVLLNQVLPEQVAKLTWWG